MARPFIVRAFTEEAPLKIVSLAIAVTLFVIVRSDREATSSAVVKVVYTLPADRAFVSEPVTEVRVGVRGSYNAIQRLDERALEPMRIDVGKNDTKVSFAPSMLKLPPGLRASSFSPSEVALVTEPVEVRTLPVRPTTEGDPAEGYRVAALKARPEEVQVRGPRSVVSSLGAVHTVALKVGGARANVSGEVALAPAARLDYLGSRLVHVEADIRPALVERTFDAMPIRVQGLTRLAGGLEPETARLILRGPADVLAGLDPGKISLVVSAQLVDLRPPGRFLRQLSVNGLPPGVAAELQPDSVVLTTHRKREDR
jgi:hypothetical protein